MRIAFLEESGRSAPEKIIVVAGVVVRKVEEALRQLVADTIPTGDRDGFLFHATDLFHGKRYFKPRETWPRERRYPILERLAAFPRAFSLPVVFGHVVKAEHRQEPEIAQHIEQQPEKDRPIDLLEIEHLAAFTRAVINIERQMSRFPRDEICMLVVEDTDQVKPLVKESYRIRNSARRHIPAPRTSSARATLPADLATALTLRSPTR